MLDDFKTELKKLSIKCIQEGEKRSQNYSLVLDHDLKSKGDQDELEFTHALVEMNGNGSPRRPVQKKQVSRMGTKISKLPSLVMRT
jgi:hypothetical protein